jgi:deazaflavin-dependent oxidoreductase (nitroreductase family)
MLPRSPGRWPIMGDMAHYVRPGWFTRHVFNGAVALATRAGLSVWGSRVLRVRGRKSGQWRSTPVNLLSLDGERFLVAPRGETQWVRNLRSAGSGELVVGSRVEPFTATEVVDEDEKVAVLRAYLKRWRAEVGVFFDGVSAASPESELRRISSRHPVFRLRPGT